MLSSAKCLFVINQVPMVPGGGQKKYFLAPPGTGSIAQMRNFRMLRHAKKIKSAKKKFLAKGFGKSFGGLLDKLFIREKMSRSSVIRFYKAQHSTLHTTRSLLSLFHLVWSNSIN